MPDTEPAKIELDDFQGIKNPILRLIMLFLPWILLAGMTIALAFTRDSYIVYLSMILAFALSILVFQFLLYQIPRVLSTIWQRGIISYKDSSHLVAPSSEEDIPNEDVLQSSERLKLSYLEFGHRFERSLNNPIGQVIIGILFALIMLVRSLYEFWMWLPHEFWTGLMYRAGGLEAIADSIRFYSFIYFSEYSVKEPLSFWSGLILEPFLGLLMGLIAWRMITCGRYIALLGREFDLTPRLQHLDQCGGLEPLGNLSLLNALIVSIWGVFLGGWIIIWSSTESGFYVPMYQALLIVPISMAIASFILPLWSIHKTMDVRRSELMDKLDNMAQKIHQFEEGRLDSASLLSAQSQDTSGDLDYMKNVYKSNQNYPTWPFNYRILLAFLSSQAVPILGLTGIGSHSITIIKSLIDFLTQLGGSP